MVSYFGGYSRNEGGAFVNNKANYIPKKYDSEKLIREHYLNISDALYTRSPILMEINFMRIALILSTVIKFEFTSSIISCISQIPSKTKSVCKNEKINQIIHAFEKKNEIIRKQ